MRILVLSDLHIEFGKLSPVHNNRRIDDGVDVVVLAGDIAEGVRRVLHEDGAGLAGQGRQGRQIADVAAQVHRQHGAHAAAVRAGQSLRQRVRRHQTAVGVHIGEHHVGVDVDGAVGRGEEGDRGNDTDVAGTDAGRQHGHVQGGGAIAAGHGVLRPDHVPTVEGDSNENAGYSAFGRLYAIGYIRGLQQAVYAQ